MFSKIKNEQLQLQFQHTLSMLVWIGIATLVGLIVGLVASAFALTLEFVNEFRMEHAYIFLGLPLAGLVINFLYKHTSGSNTKGTNLIIRSVRKDDPVSWTLAPVIFVSTALTHLFGGSAGREGAALQIGGSIGQNLANKLGVGKSASRIITMSAMSACFAGLFGTPITATIFSMEMINVGTMNYAAFIPCALASIVSIEVAKCFGIHAESFTVQFIPELNIDLFLKVMFLAALCSLVSILFVVVMEKVHHLFDHYFKDPAKKIVVGGLILIVLSFIFGKDFQGAGMSSIVKAIEHGQVIWYAFLVKLLFTAVTIGSGYKGGEIVPCFFVGATFGCLASQYLGIPAGFGASIGLMVVFCGATNAPITSLFLAFELFGFKAMAFYLIADAIGYMLSSYYSLYNEQMFTFSKYTTSNLESRANHNID